MTEPQFYIFVQAWMGLALLIFCINLFIKAPYGRHTSSKAGPMIDNRWGWIIMELPALVTVPILFVLGDAEKLPLSWFFLGLWCLHYIHRTLIFPFRIRTKGKKMPLAIVLSAIFFNLVNGYIIGTYLGNYATFSLDWIYNWYFILGLILFVVGMFINLQSDTILINLRKPGETGYKIPQGGFFKFVSCPNLFGEIVEWIGFALMTFGLPTASFALWTAANLIPRAKAHHEWYLEKFEDYPDRRRVIPFLF